MVMRLHAEKWDSGKFLIKKITTTEEGDYEEKGSKEIRTTETLIHRTVKNGGGTCIFTVDITCSDNQDVIGGLELIFNQIKDSLAESKLKSGEILSSSYCILDPVERKAHGIKD